MKKKNLPKIVLVFLLLTGYMGGAIAMGIISAIMVFHMLAGLIAGAILLFVPFIVWFAITVFKRDILVEHDLLDPKKKKKEKKQDGGGFTF